MDLFIFNRNEELIDTLSGNAEKSASHFFDAQIVKELNKGCQLTFTVDRSETTNDSIAEENLVAFKDGDKIRLAVIKEVVDLHNDAFTSEVFCEDAYIELYDEIILEEFRDDLSYELEDALAHLLQGTRWELGEVDDVNRIKLSEFQGLSVLEGINQLVSRYDVEVDFTVEMVGNKITKRLVHLKKAMGRDLGKRIEYRKDLESLKRTTSTADIKTAIIPLGKQNEETGEYTTIKNVVWTKAEHGLDKPKGQMYLEDPEATAQWGYKGTDGFRPRFMFIEYSEIEDPAELIKYANLQLASHKTPKITYEVEAVDLYKLLDDEDYSFEMFEIGDTVGIIDHEFNPPLALTSRVVKIEEYLSETETGRKITLGNTVGSIVDKDTKSQVSELMGQMGSVSVDLSGIQSQLNKLNGKVGSGVWEEIQAINQMLFGSATGFHYMENGDGIWVYDKPVDQQPTKALVLKGGTLGIASWDKQLQQWQVGTFIDGTQVNASLINTGFLNADRIQAGSIKAEKLEVGIRERIENATTTEEVESKLQTHAEAIELSVSKKYETKEGVNESVQGIIAQTEALHQNYQDLTNDEKITPNEKLQLKVELSQIQAKTEAMADIVQALDDTTLTSFMDTLTQKKEAVETILAPVLANMTVTTDMDEESVHQAVIDFYEAYEIALKLAQMSMNATVSETKTQLSVVNDGLNVAISKSTEALDMKYTVDKHFNFTDAGWVEIFATVNGQQGRFKTQITDQKLAFLDGGSEVAYLSNQELYITNARILESLQAGNMSLEKSSKGGLIFKWKG